MANGKIRFGKQSGGQLALVIPDGVSNTEVVVPESGELATEQYVDNKYSGFKNYIINGNFDVWQYGTSQTTGGYGSDDRWFNGNIGSTRTHSQITCTDTDIVLFNASKFSRTVVSSVAGAGNYVVKRTSIEDVTKLAGKTVTVSFWAKADSNKNIWLEFKQIFGVGGSPSATTAGIYGQAIPLTTTWQKKTITVTLPSIAGKTLGTDGVHTTSTEIQFWFDVGSAHSTRIPTGIQQSGTFDIAQVQLEEGSVATPFEQRPYGLELSLCKRYYQRDIELLYVGNVTNGIAYPALLILPVSMRITPTAIFSTNRSLIGFAQPTVSLLENTRFGCVATAATTGPATWGVLYSLSAEL